MADTNRSDVIEFFCVGIDVNAFHVLAMSGREALSRPYRFDLSLVEQQPRTVESLLGASACIRIRGTDAARAIHGVLSKARSKRVAGAFHLDVRLVSRNWWLKKES